MSFIKHFFQKEGSLEEIIINLNCIFNVRRAWGEHYLPYLGLSGYDNSLDVHSNIDRIRREIEENIKMHEPRVELIGNIKYIDSQDKSILQFEITCKLKDNDYPVYINFDTKTYQHYVYEPGVS